MPTQVLTIAQQKGGAGKTTLAAHLAVAYATRDMRVAVIDIDPQASLAEWNRVRRQNRRSPIARNDVTVTAVPGWRLGMELERLQPDHDVVLIDSPPHAETDARVAVRCADLVLIPVQPSPMDLWAMRATIDLARSAQVPVLIVLNRVAARSAMLDQLRRSLVQQQLPIARTAIANRLTFASTMLEGRTVLETTPRSMAAAEIGTLLDEIAGHLATTREAS